MGRYTPEQSTQHMIEKLCSDCYRISWVIDHYYKNSRLRFPRRHYRDTDLKGAIRFAKKWNLEFSKEEESNG